MRDITYINRSSTDSSPMNAHASPIFSRLLEKLLTGATLTFALSLAMQGMGSSAAHSQEVQSPVRSSVATAPVVARPIVQDGTYIYGQSSSSEQVGSTYLVFEVKRGNVVGAFYMPHSSFDCFQGAVQSDRLALTIRNSDEGTTYPYSVALRPQPIASTAAKPPLAFELPGFRSLKQLSPNDQRILSTCKAAYVK
jgi:hypothetical protein